MKTEAALELLIQAFESGRPAQAYLVVGPPRGGASMLAEGVLLHLLCAGEQKPCGECRACRQVQEHTHPDVLWIEPQKRSRQIGVDEVRSMQSRVYQTSFEGGWRSCVMLGADRLNVSAANAFLKTLEEPPEKCVFFLLTDSPSTLLPTIMSRCQRISLAEAAEGLDPELCERLAEILAPQRLRGPIAALGQADVLVALLKELKTAAEEEVTERASDEDTKETIQARASALFRERRTAIMQFLLGWYRDQVMLLSEGEELVYNTKYLDVLKQRAGALSMRQALRNVEIIEDMNRRLERNVTESPVLELGFSQLR